MELDESWWTACLLISYYVGGRADTKKSSVFVSFHNPKRQLDPLNWNYPAINSKDEDHAFPSLVCIQMYYNFFMLL